MIPERRLPACAIITPSTLHLQSPPSSIPTSPDRRSVRATGEEAGEVSRERDVTSALEHIPEVPLLSSTVTVNLPRNHLIASDPKDAMSRRVPFLSPIMEDSFIPFGGETMSPRQSAHGRNSVGNRHSQHLESSKTQIAMHLLVPMPLEV